MVENYKYFNCSLKSYFLYIIALEILLIGETMVVGVCGFCWSGSGAVLDYLMEFDRNQVITREFSIAYHPDGLSDLDFNLNQNCARFLSSGVSIPRFKKVSNLLLSDITNGQSKKITDEYIESILQARWIGSEEGQVLLHNAWFYRKVGMRIRYKIINRLPMDFCIRHKIYPLNDMFFSIRPENFYVHTQTYTDLVFKSIGLDLDRPIIVNQLFPANSPSRCMRYFHDSKAILVDRDPRDIYISLKAVFPGNSYSVPLDNAKNYVAYYKNMHKTVNEELSNPNVLYIKFEDFVFRHEIVANVLKEFLALSEHSTPKKYFIPDQSAANTCVYEKYPEYEDDIKYIEDNLTNYLYDFSGVSRPTVAGQMFDDNPMSVNYKFK